MQLKVLLPTQVCVDNVDVVRIVVETREGSFGILPNRLDCVAALAPGILTYQEKEGEPVYLAVAEGVLVKVGAQVLVSVRDAIGGSDLGRLQEAVKQRFLTLDKQQRDVHDALVRMEGRFVGQIVELFHDR